MRPAFFAFLALLAPFAFAGPAAAQPVQPLDRLLPEIRRTHPGHFYDADGPHPGAGGSQHYHLKWMTPDGRIIWYDTDARTGRVLGASPGRDGFDSREERFGSPYGPRGYYGMPEPGRGNFRDGANGYGGYGAPYGGRGGYYGQPGTQGYGSRGGYGPPGGYSRGGGGFGGYTPRGGYSHGGGGEGGGHGHRGH